MKKIYTIKITQVSRNQSIWYASRIGDKFEATLEARVSDRGSLATVVFVVNPCWFVYPIDCEVISERIVHPYVKDK